MQPIRECVHPSEPRPGPAATAGTASEAASSESAATQAAETSETATENDRSSPATSEAVIIGVIIRLLLPDDLMPAVQTGIGDGFSPAFGNLVYHLFCVW